MDSTYVPAGPPPPGVIPNFENPSDTLHAAIVATTAIVIALTTCFVAARLAARWSISSFAADDYMLLLAWALNIAYNALLVWQDTAGVGRHVWDVSILSATGIAKQGWIIEMVYCFVIWSAKTALILQLKRTFAPTNRGVINLACLALLWVNLGFYVAMLFAAAFQCIPQERIWDPSITTGYCVSRDAELIAAGAFNIVTDIGIFVLPLWAIWHLNMVVKHKLGIAAVFTTGLLAITASVGRTIFTVQIIWSTDSTYLIAQVALWTVAELAAIILCTCFPLMPRFIKMLQGKPSASSASAYHLSTPIGTHSSQSGPFAITQPSAHESDTWLNGHNEIIKESQEPNSFQQQVYYHRTTGIERRVDIALQSYVIDAASQDDTS